MKKYKPYTPSLRHKKNIEPNHLLNKKNKPEKKNTFGYNRKQGRNNRGSITSFHRGGGHKRLYRLIDFKRTKTGIFGKVQTVEYDPNRNALIALIHYTDGDKKYILYFNNLYIGKTILSSPNAPLGEGNALPLLKIPYGTKIHNIEIHPGKGGQLVRAAGTKATILYQYKKMVALLLPSKKKRFVLNSCWATIGTIGNNKVKFKLLGKAGSSRWISKRPHVRGSAMNAVDHPHGGGEGKAPIGRKKPYTPWGKTALGAKTRKIKKWSDLYVKKFKY